MTIQLGSTVSMTSVPNFQSFLQSGDGLGWLLFSRKVRNLELIFDTK